VGQREGRSQVPDAERSTQVSHPGEESSAANGATSTAPRDQVNNAGSFEVVDDANRLVNDVDQGQTVPGADMRPQHVANENALFRFSTEGLIPAWLPLPAISFEIVRRQPVVVDVSAPEMRQANDIAIAGNGTGGARETDEPAAEDIAEPLRGNHRSTSLLRRLLGIVFAPPMTPEEEETALAQLVEMFPQYERDDLLRELQSRGSIEHVTESILLGAFSGLPRADD